MNKQEQNNELENTILKLISKEIEEKYNCKVISISFAEILSLCVQVKIQFNDDVLFRPFNDLPIPESIVWSERAITFFKRVDLFECMSKNKGMN